MSKKAITIIASELTYKNLSTFNNIDELNKTVRYYKEQFMDKLTKSTVAVLDHLQAYSCKYLGVSFQTKNNVAQSLNISRKTVQRACKVLEDLGIIKQLEMKRKSDMRQTSNAIQIMPIENDCPTSVQKMSSQKDNISLKQNTNKNIIRTQSVPINQSFLPSYINLEFARLASCYFQNNNIVELWRIVTIHSQINKLPSETLKKASMEGLKSLVYKIKQGKVKSINGYFNGIIKKLCKKYSIEDMFLSVFDA